jgi:hypothetical protein
VRRRMRHRLGKIRPRAAGPIDLPSSSSALGVRRLPVPAGGDRPCGALAPAVPPGPSRATSVEAVCARARLAAAAAAMCGRACSCHPGEPAVSWKLREVFGCKAGYMGGTATVRWVPEERLVIRHHVGHPLLGAA